MDKLKTIVLTFLFISMTSWAVAQSSIKIKVSNSIEMTNNLDEVWTAISNLENLDKLVPEIIGQTKTVGNGKGTIVTLMLKSNGTEVVEKITKLDNNRRIISYEMVATPMPMSYYKATIRIVPQDSNGYTISFKAVLKTTGEHETIMENTIENFQKTLLANVKKMYNEK